MIKYCNPKICLHDSCKIRTKKRLCKRHCRYNISFIPFYKNICPFELESKVIKFQQIFRNRNLIKKNRLMLKKKILLVNYNDPITQEKIFSKNFFIYDLDLLYPIIISKKMYVYKLESLIEIIKFDKLEVFTQTLICKSDIFNIKKLVKLKKINVDSELTENEIFFLKKIETFQKLDILGTYFPIKLYNNLTYDEKNKIFNELKLMWNAFCIDNGIDVRSLYKKNIKWDDMINVSNIDKLLIEKINFLINENFDYNLQKMISYIIIGAFAYVSSEIKNIYNDFDFI